MSSILVHTFYKRTGNIYIPLWPLSHIVTPFHVDGYTHSIFNCGKTHKLKNVSEQPGCQAKQSPMAAVAELRTTGKLLRLER